jgi:hypothetical protein
MLTRTFDGQALQRIVNDPSVFPLIACGDDSVNLAPYVEDVSNVCLMNEHGGFLYVRLDHGTYEVHTQFLPPGRGRNALEAAKESLLWMFTRTDCMEVLTKVPVGNAGALRLCELTGFAIEHRQWATTSGGHMVLLDYLALRFEEWFKRAEGLTGKGVWFHEQLEAAGSHASHEQDDWHNRAVGFAALCAEADQVGKAVRLYNRWASFYGYLPVRVLALDPVVFGFDDGTTFTLDATNGVKLCQVQ